MYKFKEVQELQPGDILAENYHPMQDNLMQLRVLNVEFAGPRILIKVRELNQPNRGAEMRDHNFHNGLRPEFWKEYTIHTLISTLDVS
jgi:hypothetical protein